MPQNPKKESQWVIDFNEIEREEWTHKLSNLVLISKRKNSSLSNLDFAQKNERYFKGRIDVFPSNKIFQTYQEWSVEVLMERQKTMIDKLIK